MISARFDRTEVQWPEVSFYSLVIMLVLGLLLMLLTGCCTGHISASVIEGPIKKVTARHDDYVQADENLGSTERDTYLLSSELLQRLVAEAKKGEQ